MVPDLARYSYYRKRIHGMNAVLSAFNKIFNTKCMGYFLVYSPVVLQNPAISY